MGCGKRSRTTCNPITVSVDLFPGDVYLPLIRYDTSGYLAFVLRVEGIGPDIA